MTRKPIRSTRVLEGARGVDSVRREALAAIKSGFRGLDATLEAGARLERELREVRPGLVVERNVGEGGMGSVHAALDHGLRRRVAVKVMHPSLDSAERDEVRFVEEAQLTGQLEHPNIVPIHEIGTTAEGRLYFTMKLVDGRPLAEMLLESPPETRTERELRELVKVVMKACDALAFAHAHGIVHRDLKPENVLVGEFGEVYVMDWGIALRAATPAESAFDDLPFPPTPPLDRLGVIIGTPEFMAPEQALGDLHRIDARTDVFGLGGILYAILTGRPPHHESDDDRTIAAAQRGAVLPPREARPGLALPPLLCAIVARALAREPADRHASVRELQEDLERFLRGSAYFPEQSFEPGDWIVREGDEADVAYVIASGACEAVREEATGWVVLRRMEAGEVFGETAIFARTRRSASVRAVTAVRVTVISRDALLDELGASSWMTPFVRTLAERFAEESRQVTALRRRATIAEVQTRAVRELAMAALARGGDPRADPRDALGGDLAEIASAVAAETGLSAQTVRTLLGEAPGLAIDGERIRIT
ncbi:MAG: protein kinase [bacterium]